jgi:hypothetical protein
VAIPARKTGWSSTTRTETGRGTREPTISRWIGWFSIVPVQAVVLFAGLTGLPGFQGVVGPAWPVAFSGLTFGRSAIVR